MKTGILIALVAAGLGYAAGLANAIPRKAQTPPAAGGTRFQMDTNASIARSLREGYYILGSDIPLWRTRLEARGNEWTARYESTVNQEYEHVLSCFGFSDAQKLRIKAHLLSIERARFFAEAYVVQMDKAKSDYDQKIQSLLGSERYQQYMGLEANRLTERRLKAMATFFNDTHAPTPTEPQRRALSQILNRAGLKPDPDGPYGSGVRAAATTGGVMSILDNELKGLQHEFGQVMKAIATDNEAKGLGNQVQDFYAALIGAKVREVESAKNPTPPPDSQPHTHGEFPSNPAI